MMLVILFLHYLVVEAVAFHLQRPLIDLKESLLLEDHYPKRPGSRRPVPELFTHRYSEQTFIGTHDSVAIRTAENNWSLSGNQYFNVSVQLQAGVRLLQAQGHPSLDGTPDPHLCHFHCALMDGGSLYDHLTTVRTFLEANPYEVVTLLFVNVGVPLEHWIAAYTATGLDRLSFTPDPEQRRGNMYVWDWPTISEMVARGQRVVSFLSSGADESRAPYLLDQFDYMFETAYDINAPTQYTCEPSLPRWTDPNVIPPRLSLVDHWLYASFLGIQYPNASYANVTNAAGRGEGMLGEHAERCRRMYGRRPNYLMVDFFNEGDVFDVEHAMNAAV